MGVQILVTRPVDQAGEWVDALAHRGFAAASLPLLHIEANPDSQALTAAWERLPQYAVAMFVSPNAVNRFLASAPKGWSWPVAVRAASTGPGTARALLTQGVPIDCLVQPPAGSAAFDSEHLWPLLAGEDWRGRSVLIVRGDGGRDWLADRWQAAGAEVSRLEAYRRVEPRWTASQTHLLATALMQPAGHIWLLSSSQAVQTLASRICLPQGIRAVATHPSIARTARACGFSEVHEAAGGFDDVVACLESMA